MDLSLIAIIISVVVLSLQIVTLLLIAGIKKSQSNFQAQQASLKEQERFEKKDNEFRRHERRPFQDNRQRPQPQPQPQPQQAPAPAGSGESVDKSLRDINLRLKNAERDQEVARRRLQQDGFPRSQQRDNRDRNERGNRDQRGGRRDNRGNRFDRPRDRDRGNWQDRGRPSAPQTEQDGSPVPDAGSPVERKDLPFPETQPTSSMAAPVASMEKDFAPVDFSSDAGLEHGRKIIVKRRMLKDGTPEPESPADVSGSSPAAADAAPAPLAASSPEEEPSATAPPDQGGEIMFGRRKAL